MTAEELVSGLRERGYTVLRSLGPGWVIIPRLKPEDPICEFLGGKGALLRPFQPERYSAPEKREYEALLTSCEIEQEPVLDAEGKLDRHLTTAARHLAIWEAAA